MNDEEMNEGPLSLGLDEVEAPSLEEEGEEEEVVSPLAAVGAASAVTPQDFLSRLLAREEEAAKRERELFQADIKRIQDAKDRLLGKPKELTGRERLDIILKTLSSRPTDPNDPRFFERKNIGTFLRDIGESGGAMRETEKAREEQRQKEIAELEAKQSAMLLPRAQAELKDIRSRIPAALKATEGEQDPESYRALVLRARASNRTVPEQIEWEANLKKPPTPKSVAIEALDRKVGQDYAEWISREGAKSATNVKRLKNAIGRLKTDKNITGPVSGYVVNNFPTLASVIYPEAKDIKSIVESVVQQDLRQILGGQFAMMENAELIRRAYDPTIGDEKNLARLETLLNQIEEVTRSKTSAFDYLNKNNTMAGFDYKQKRVTPDDFLTESDIRRLEKKKPDSKGIPETKVIDGETWTLFIDEKGAKAYVAPDGLRYEEVK